MEIVLASTSRWRRKMLSDVGIRAVGVDPGVDESVLVDPDPVACARLRACAKADSVAARYPSDIVIGADQVVWDGEHVFGKPADPEHHFRMLAGFRGKTHSLVTSVCILAPGVRRIFEEETRMTVRADISDRELRDYVATADGSGCAAGYTAEGLGAFLFARMDGDWFNIIGLPLPKVMDVLRELGWRYGNRFDG